MKGAPPKNIRYSERAVCIRPCRMEDKNSVLEAVGESLPDLMPFMPWCHAAYSMEDSEDYLALCEEAWEEGTEYGFVILEERSGSLLGLCGINHINPLLKIGNLGYWIRTSRTGRGIATSATKLLARFAFEYLDLQRLEIVVDPENSASRRVAEKAGAVEEGLMRNRLRFKDHSRDAVMFSLIPGDFKD